MFTAIIILALASAALKVLRAVETHNYTFLFSAFARAYLGFAGIAYWFKVIEAVEYIHVGVILLLVSDILNWIVGTISDHYDKKNEFNKLLTSLLQLQDKYAFITENVPVGIYVINKNAKFEYVNLAVCKITGFTREELLSKSAFDLVSPEYHDLIRQNINKRLTGEANELKYSIEIVTKQGTKKQLFLNSIRTVNGHLTITGTALETTREA